MRFVVVTTALLSMQACIIPTANAFGISSNVWQPRQRNARSTASTASAFRTHAKVMPPHVGPNQQLISTGQRLYMASNVDDFPTFEGDVIHRPTDNFRLEVGNGALNYWGDGADPATKAYVEAIYGYGTSSFTHRNTPAAVVYAKNQNDIVTAVEYAYKSGISLAIRSGGHQYGAFCSGTKKDIVIDLSDQSAEFNKSLVYNASDKTWTVGAGVKLERLIVALKEKGAFVTHGECTGVRCGGHIHTGGYSPFFSRSFGFFVDHITEFTIVLAPSTKTNFQAQAKTVKKPVKNKPSDDDNLWFAVMGGSPGHFGVVTNLTIKPRWDKDHKGARALTISRPYTKAGFKTAIEILAEYCDDDNLPADYDINVFLISSRDYLQEQMEGRKNLDTCMRDNRPDIYGEKPEGVKPLFALVVNWNDVSGVGFDETDPEGYNAAEIFKKIKKRFNMGASTFAMTLNELGIRANDNTAGGRRIEIFGLKGEKDMDISELDTILGFPARIEASPYYGTDRLFVPPEGGPNLGATNFVDGTVDTLDDAHNEVDCWPTPQWGITGGKHSRIRKDKAANPDIALSHRNAALNCIYYVHYDNVKNGMDQNGPGMKALENVERMEKVLVDAFGGDHRWLAFCGQDSNLETLWPYYFDSKADYDRVKKVKNDYDPNNVFTAHTYGVSSG